MSTDGPDTATKLTTRDPALRVVLALTLALQLLTWHGLSGYQLADSVEYMERAYLFVRSEPVVDSRIVRSFGFSALLTPIFAVAHWIGLEDHNVVVWLVRLLQMSIGLALVTLCAKLGAQLGGRSAGILAAFVVGSNPIFLQFSVSPLADVAGSLGVALSLRAALRPSTGFRGGMRVGLWMGLALLMAYKTVPLSGMMMLLVILRDRRRGVVAAAGMATALLLCAVFQAGLDRIVYGVWGASILTYFGENVIGVIGQTLAVAGLESTATEVYRWYYADARVKSLVGMELRQIQPTDWYLRNLHQMLVWPVLAGTALGVLRALRRPSWPATVIVLLTGGFIFILHQKGSKEFRLWLPLLATLGPLAGWGLAWALGDGRSRVRLGTLAAALAASIWLSFDVLAQRNTRIHSGYWRALEYIEARVATEREDHPDRPPEALVSAYNWAIFLRDSANLEVTKLQYQIDVWGSFTDDMKFAVDDKLQLADWFIVHEPILTQPGHADLAHRVNSWFQVEAVFYERAFEDLGPIYVMRKKEGPEFDVARRSLFEVKHDVSEDEARALAEELGSEEPVRMIKREHKEDLWMLGYTYEQLPGDGHGWLSTWWYAVDACLADYTIVTRLSSHDERNAWQANAPPTWSCIPTNTWEAGTLVRDSRLVVAAEDPYLWDEPFRPMGGPYRRGDYMPAYLWIDVAAFYMRCDHCGEEIGIEHECDGIVRNLYRDGSKEVSGRLERARFGDVAPRRVGDLVGATLSPEGWRWSVDDLSQVGRFFLPVHPEAVVPDDGRPIPD